MRLNIKFNLTIFVIDHWNLSLIYKGLRPFARYLATASAVFHWNLSLIYKGLRPKLSFDYFSNTCFMIGIYPWFIRDCDRLVNMMKMEIWWISQIGIYPWFIRDCDKAFRSQGQINIPNWNLSLIYKGLRHFRINNRFFDCDFYWNLSLIYKGLRLAIPQRNLQGRHILEFIPDL